LICDLFVGLELRHNNFWVLGEVIPSPDGEFCTKPRVLLSFKYLLIGETATLK
jgi:hypothetical protein